MKWCGDRLSPPAGRRTCSGLVGVQATQERPRSAASRTAPAAEPPRLRTRIAGRPSRTCARPSTFSATPALRSMPSRSAMRPRLPSPGSRSGTPGLHRGPARHTWVQVVARRSHRRVQRGRAGHRDGRWRRRGWQAGSAIVARHATARRHDAATARAARRATRTASPPAPGSATGTAAPAARAARRWRGTAAPPCTSRRWARPW